MQKSLKFLHTLTALGLTGGLAAYMLMLTAMPDAASVEAYASLRQGLAVVAKWLLVPSMMGVLISGLLAMAAHHPYMNMPWAWIKALSGILIFEATLASIDAPAQRAAAAAARAAAGEIDAETLAILVRDEWAAWWTLLALSVANMALGVWRPRFNLRGAST